MNVIIQKNLINDENLNLIKTVCAVMCKKENTFVQNEECEVSFSYEMRNWMFEFKLTDEVRQKSNEYAEIRRKWLNARSKEKKEFYEFKKEKIRVSLQPIKAFNEQSEAELSSLLGLDKDSIEVCLTASTIEVDITLSDISNDEEEVTITI